MNFAAIDFETANQSRASVCQTGVAIVRNGAVEDVQEWLVRPPTGLDNFNPRNVQVHRITPRMAANGILWGESAERLADLVGDLPVIAHNAPFDRSVYLAACERLALSPWDWKWYCTLEISQGHIPIPHHSLDQVAAHLGIDIRDRHQAGSDAHAAAEVLLKISQNSGIHQLRDLGLELPAPAHRNRRTRESEATSFIPAHVMSRYNRVSDLPKPSLSADPQHPLYGQHVVLSGKIGEHDRDHWIDQLAEVGAQPQLNITNKTTLVFIGADAGKSKASNAEKRRANGQPVLTIPGDRLIALLNHDQAVEFENDLESTGDVVKPAYVIPESQLPPAKTEGPAQSEPPTEQTARIHDTPTLSQPAAAVPMNAQPTFKGASSGEHDVLTFQQWSGPAGSLPSDLTLTMQHRGRKRRITTTKLNRNPTGLLKRLGAFVGIIFGSFILAAILTPLLGPTAPLIFLGGIFYSIIFLIRSARADRLRWQYWAGKPEPRKVLIVSEDAAYPPKRHRR